MSPNRPPLASPMPTVVEPLQIGASDSFSKSVRRRGCSQAEMDVLAQNAVVLRYEGGFILKKSVRRKMRRSQVWAFMFSRSYS
jgi:hypothetical protein